MRCVLAFKGTTRKIYIEDSTRIKQIYINEGLEYKSNKQVSLLFIVEADLKKYKQSNIQVLR